MADVGRKIALAKAHDEMIRGALVVALERAGGTMTYSATEYQAIAERFGGPESVGIEIRASMGPDGPQSTLRLVGTPKGRSSSPVM